MNISSKNWMALQQTFNQFSVFNSDFFGGGAKELARTFWDRRNGSEVWYFTKIFYKALGSPNRTESHPFLLSSCPWLYSSTLTRWIGLLFTCNESNYLSTTSPHFTKWVKRPLSYYSFIVQVQLVKNYPYNLNSLGRPPLGNLFNPFNNFKN